MGDRDLALVSVARSDRGHLSPLLALLPHASLYEYRAAEVHEPFEVACAAGYAVTNFAHRFAYRKPDLVVIFGDRWEQHAAATAAFTLGIPIVHLHAGERTQAVLDDGYRAAISALATIHVTAAHPYCQRLEKMGYERVYCLGAPGLARLKMCEPRTYEPDRILVTFHPETRNLADVARQVAELNAAMKFSEDVEYFVTAPGMDAGRDVILGQLDGPHCVFSDREWVDALSTADVIVGNSSCGIIEAPTIKLPSVNIGDRQTGRLMASSVIQVAHDRHAIRAGIAQALNPEWRTKNLTGVNPYGDRHAAERIAEFLQTVSL